MDQYLQSLFDKFDAAAKASAERNDKWIVIDCVYEHLDDLGIYDYHEVLGRILALIERFPDLDYGAPGPFGSFIEAQPVAAYALQLLASLVRQPSSQVLGWLDRTLYDEDFQNGSGPNPVSLEQYVTLLEAVLSHPAASEDCRSFARDCLESPHIRRFLHSGTQA